MPAEPRGPGNVEKAISVTPQELASLTPETLEDLRQKHGLEINLRSSAPGVNRILTQLGREAEVAADFTRGFDRTSGGFDRYYDRDIASLDPLERVSNPADLAARIAAVLREQGGGGQP
jgi:hypothetical protein